jgi:hypothetical protein
MMDAATLGARDTDALLTERDFRALLGGISERKFKMLRADGIVPAPLEFGPRLSRWTRDDFAETLSRLPRRAAQPEPTRLAEGRRARIEGLKKPAQPTERLQHREAFEKWLLQDLMLSATWNAQRNCYDEFEAQIAFQAWIKAKEAPHA